MEIRSLTFYIDYQQIPIKFVVLILYFRTKRYISKPPVVYSCHDFLVSFSWEQQHNLFLVFNDLDIMKILDQFFYGLCLWAFSILGSRREFSYNILKHLLYEKINFSQYPKTVMNHSWESWGNSHYVSVVQFKKAKLLDFDRNTSEVMLFSSHWILLDDKQFWFDPLLMVIWLRMCLSRFSAIQFFFFG